MAYAGGAKGKIQKETSYALLNEFLFRLKTEPDAVEIISSYDLLESYEGK